MSVLFRVLWLDVHGILASLSLDVLRAYEGEDIELQLPENLTVYDIDYLGVWCVAYKHNFGHVQIPHADDLWVPPALGQTRIKVSTVLPPSLLPV